MSRVLAVVGLVTVAVVVLFVLGYLILPRLAASILFCLPVWN